MFHGGDTPSIGKVSSSLRLKLWYMQCLPIAERIALQEMPIVERIGQELLLGWRAGVV